MSVALRIFLIAVSFLTAFFVLRKIKKSQFVIGDTLFWAFFCLLLLILAIFPQIAIKTASLIGIVSPANLVYLVIIFLLLVKVFNLSAKISQVESKLTELAEEYAIKHKED